MILVMKFLNQHMDIYARSIDDIREYALMNTWWLQLDRAVNNPDYGMRFGK